MSTLQIREPARRRAASEPPCPANDPAVALRFLKLLATPATGCVELRILRGAFDRRGDVHRADRLGAGFVGSTLAGWYDDPDRLARGAGALDGFYAHFTRRRGE